MVAPLLPFTLALFPLFFPLLYFLMAGPPPPPSFLRSVGRSVPWSDRERERALFLSPSSSCHLEQINIFSLFLLLGAKAGKGASALSLSLSLGGGKEKASKQANLLLLLLLLLYFSPSLGLVLVGGWLSFLPILSLSPFTHGLMGEEAPTTTALLLQPSPFSFLRPRAQFS